MPPLRHFRQRHTHDFRRQPPLRVTPVDIAAPLATFAAADMVDYATLLRHVDIADTLPPLPPPFCHFTRRALCRYADVTLLRIFPAMRFSPPPCYAAAYAPLRRAMAAALLYGAACRCMIRCRRCHADAAAAITITTGIAYEDSARRAARERCLPARRRAMTIRAVRRAMRGAAFIYACHYARISCCLR